MIFYEISPLIVVLLIYFLAFIAFIYYKKDISIGNFAWGGALLLISIFLLLASWPAHARLIIAVIITCIWSSRIIIQLYARYKRGNDPRFTQWLHNKSLTALLFSIAWIMICQTFLTIIMSLPLFAITHSGSHALTWIDGIAFLGWLMGFLIESKADYELYKFRSDSQNQEKVLKTGLWHYSRHPNYFGEILQWWSIWLFTYATPYMLIAAAAPLTITVLLCFVTGIPLLEHAMAQNKEYQEYKKETSVLIPWFTKQN